MSTAEAAFDERMARAQNTVHEADLTDLLVRHREALDRFLEARRQHTEAKRAHQDAVDYRAVCELDALLEMEQDPDYVPGKNAEARKLQAEVFLARSAGVLAAKEGQRRAGLVVDDASLAADRARAQVDHLGLMIGARRSELDLLASFARGTV